MQKILIDRPQLDEHDFTTIRSMYTECQAWARHYESLIVTANTFLISSAMIFLGFAFNKEINPKVSFLIPVIPIILSAVGIGISLTLFKLYGSCVERLIKIENLLNCFDETKLSLYGNYDSILSKDLMKLPVKWPTSIKFFIILHLILLMIYIVTLILLN